MFNGRKFGMTRVSKLYSLKETYSAELRFFYVRGKRDTSAIFSIALEQQPFL